MNSRTVLFELTNLIPVGKVATYGQVGSIVSGITGKQIRGQVAGFFLSGMKQEEMEKYAWQRVVAMSGAIPADKLGFRGAIQRQKLTEEGIVFDNGSIDMIKYGIDYNGFLELEKLALTKFQSENTLTNVK